MIIGYSRTFGGGASLPQTNLTMHFDFSDISTLYKTYTPTNNPAYSDVATADADVIEIACSIVPIATSDWTLHNANDDTRSPILRLTTPLLGSQCLDFDGSNDKLVLGTRDGTNLAISNVFAAGAKTCLIAFRCESLPASDGVFQPLFADASVGNFFWGVYVYNQAGTVKLLFQNHDGNYDSLFGDTIAVNTNYVAMARHESGTLYSSLNGGSESSIASGNTSNMTNSPFLCGGSDASVFNGRIGEIACYNAALTGTDLSDAITYFTDKWT